MTSAQVVDGREVEPVLVRAFENTRVSYIHIHFAGPGCYACRADRDANQ
jgi:hypothetical protein